MHVTQEMLEEAINDTMLMMAMCDALKQHQPPVGRLNGFGWGGGFPGAAAIEQDDQMDAKDLKGDC